MRIEIRKDAVIITFDTVSENFESSNERNKFFRGLYGWNQVVPGNDKKYTYRRNGILDDVPHIKIADSAFIVAMEHMKRLIEYFEEWEDKVDYEIMEIMMKRKDMTRLFTAEDENMEER